MQGIEFDEEKDVGIYPANKVPQPKPVGKPSLISQILEKTGISDKTVGNLILLGVAMILMGITFYLYAKALGKSVPSKQSVEQISAQIKVMREMQRTQ